MIIGDQAQVRERAIVGERTVLGRGSTIDFDTRVGARVSIQTLVYLTASAVVEDDVFIGPGVTTTNDDTMDRHPAGEPLQRARSAPGLPGRWRRHAHPGRRDRRGGVRRRRRGRHRATSRRATVVMGVPARVVRHVSDEDLLERWR